MNPVIFIVLLVMACIGSYHVGYRLGNYIREKTRER